MVESPNTFQLLDSNLKLPQGCPVISQFIMIQKDTYHFGDSKDFKSWMPGNRDKNQIPIIQYHRLTIPSVEKNIL
jgi:hypothetical protein